MQIGSGFNFSGGIGGMQTVDDFVVSVVNVTSRGVSMSSGVLVPQAGIHMMVKINKSLFI
jgi:hypothetical protein